MDKVQAEAIRATGSTWLQWINYGVQPQVMPRLIGLSMYRLDINFRESAILGLRGCGRHRRHAEHRLRPLRVRHGRRDPDHHHRDRDGAGIPLGHHPGKGAIDAGSGPPQRTPRSGADRNRSEALDPMGNVADLVAVAVFVYCWQRISDATTWFFVWDAPQHRE
jgi:hypothetical protein